MQRIIDDNALEGHGHNMRFKYFYVDIYMCAMSSQNTSRSLVSINQENKEQ